MSNYKAPWTQSPKLTFKEQLEEELAGIDKEIRRLHKIDTCLAVISTLQICIIVLICLL